MNAAEATGGRRIGNGSSQAQTEHRARLHKELAQAREEWARLERKLQHRPDFGLGEGSPEIYQWEMNLALRGRLQAKIESLEEALLSLEQGEYGRCEVCGNKIAPERLEILPDTTLCISCAQKVRR